MAEDDSFVYPTAEMETVLGQETPNAPWFTNLLVRFSFLVKFIFAVIRECLQQGDWITAKGKFDAPKHKDFVPLLSDQQSLYARQVLRFGSDVVNHVVSGVPGVVTTLRDRLSNDYGWTYEFPGTEREVLNMGSYNYLGFAQNKGPCAEAAREAITEHGVATCSSAQHFGNTRISRHLNLLVAEYLNAPAAICFPMGYGTNTMNLPALIEKECLILSDELNHSSLILGSRLSGATIKVFKHNDMKDLEQKLADAVLYGQHGTRRPYKKIFIIIEGIYSMEGTIAPLPAVIALKKKYKAYLFLDEAHSIGALGRTGRGVVEYFGCDPTDVDIRMGTLTKSFAAMGGYIAGSKTLIDHLRIYSHDAVYGTAISPPVAQQVISSMGIIMGKDGTDDGRCRIEQLMRNTHYFRKNLKKLGILTYGHMDSPVVPCILFFCTKTVHFSRESLKRKLATVAVGYPATPMTKFRTRFCISAGHAKEQLDMALDVCSELADEVNGKYAMEEAKEWRNVQIKY